MPQYRSDQNIYSVITEDDTWTAIQPGYEIPEGSICKIDLRVLGADYIVNYASWSVNAVLRRYLTGAPIVVSGGALVVAKSATGAAGWDVRLAVNGMTVNIEVKGSIGQTIDWLLIGEDPVKMSGASSAFNSEVLLQNLTSYWKLDEPSTALGPVTRMDSVLSSANDLTDNNTTPSGTGIISNAASFLTLNSEYLSTTATLTPSGAARSISLWWNRGALDCGIFECSPNVADGSPPLLYAIYLESLQPRIDVWQGGAQRPGSSGASIIGAWVHIVYTYDPADGDTNVLYVNGIFDATWTAVDSGTAGPIRLGVGFPGYATGLVDEVGVWARVLTPVEVAVLYNAGAGLTYPFI